jgi:thioredoxin 1
MMSYRFFFILALVITLISTVQSTKDGLFSVTPFSRTSIKKRSKFTSSSSSCSIIDKCYAIRGGSSVPYFTSKSVLDSALSDPQNAGKLFVIDFTATWCGPCKMIAPFFEEMSVEFGDACVFLKVDVDEGGEIAQAYSVMSMPTFLFIKDGKIVDRFSGASVEKLRQTVFSHISE